MSNLRRGGNCILWASVEGIGCMSVSLQEEEASCLHLVAGQVQRKEWAVQVHMTSKPTILQFGFDPRIIYSSPIILFTFFLCLEKCVSKVMKVIFFLSGLWVDSRCKWTKWYKKNFLKNIIDIEISNFLGRRTLIQMSVLLMYVRKWAFELMCHIW